MVGKAPEASPPPVCWAGTGSSEAGSKWTSGLGSAANRTLPPPVHLLEVSPLDEDNGSKGNLMEALGLISWEVGHLDVQRLQPETGVRVTGAGAPPTPLHTHAHPPPWQQESW